MVKKRAKASSQLKLGLLSDLDSDIFVESHDEIMLWVDEHIEGILRKAFPQLFRHGSILSSKVWERPMTTSGRDKRLLGFADLYWVVTHPPAGHIAEPANFGFIEVKTKIRPGPDIRQIRAYMEFLREEIDPHGWRRLSCPLVVSPDCRYEKLLNEQKILFLPYDPKKWE
jgi:hypothetical protein